MRVVVSDSGPLICLGRLDLLRLLPALFTEVQVPSAVLLECAARQGNLDAERIEAAVTLGWLLRCEPEPVPEGPLGRGERAAIARALAVNAGLLTDDHEARVYAASLKIVVFGTLGILVRAKRAGLVPQLSPLIEALRAGGQRFGRGVVQQTLRAAGEAKG
jgi:predicted nucleic acid-binding protein